MRTTHSQFQLPIILSFILESVSLIHAGERIDRSYGQSEADMSSPAWIWSAGATLAGGHRTTELQSAPAGYASAYGTLSRKFDSGPLVFGAASSHWGEFVEFERLWQNSFSTAVQFGSETSRFTLFPRILLQSLDWQSFSRQTDLTFDYTWGTPHLNAGVSLTVGYLRIIDSRFEKFSGPVRELKAYAGLSDLDKLNFELAFTIGRSGLLDEALGISFTANYLPARPWTLSLTNQISQSLVNPEGLFKGLSAQIGYKVNREVSLSFAQSYESYGTFNSVEPSKESRSTAGLIVALTNVNE